MIVLGADAHKRSHTVAAVVAATGELLGEQTVAVGRRGFGALLVWARSLDGERVWAFRYSSRGRPSSLFHSSKVMTLRAQYPDNPIFHALSNETRLVVSEPLSDLAGVWNEVPQSSYGVSGDGQDELKTFTP